MPLRATVTRSNVTDMSRRPPSGNRLTANRGGYSLPDPMERSVADHIPLDPLAMLPRLERRRLARVLGEANRADSPR